MMEIRYSADRGQVDHGWLLAKHSFSFAEYFDPAYMRFGLLRVLNEDRVAGGQGFGMHGHKDMEIITYIISGTLEHRDSMGHTAQIVSGDIQTMSAGTGVEHSEINPEPTKPVHLLQIWIYPIAKDLSPSYQQKSFAKEFASGNLIKIVSTDGQDNTIKIKQKTIMYARKPSPHSNGGVSSIPMAQYTRMWIQIVGGTVTAKVDQQTISGGSGDGLVIDYSKEDSQPEVHLSWDKAAEFVVIQLP